MFARMDQGVPIYISALQRRENYVNDFTPITLAKLGKIAVSEFGSEILQATE
jgi:hypothetical protein